MCCSFSYQVVSGPSRVLSARSVLRCGGRVDKGDAGVRLVLHGHITWRPAITRFDCFRHARHRKLPSDPSVCNYPVLPHRLLHTRKEITYIDSVRAGEAAGVILPRAVTKHGEAGAELGELLDVGEHLCSVGACIRPALCIEHSVHAIAPHARSHRRAAANCAFASSPLLERQPHTLRPHTPHTPNEECATQI